MALQQRWLTTSNFAHLSYPLSWVCLAAVVPLFKKPPSTAFFFLVTFFTFFFFGFGGAAAVPVEVVLIEIVPPERTRGGACSASDGKHAPTRRDWTTLRTFPPEVARTDALRIFLSRFRMLFSHLARSVRLWFIIAASCLIFSWICMLF